MPRSVLLVDDTAFLRSMLREILERSGAYRVVAEASDGTSALLLAPEFKPDLIITDLIMPSLDGVEMTRALAGENPAPKLIVAAWGDQEGGVLNALAAGASEFVLKPFAEREVIAILGGPPPLPSPFAPENQRRLILRIVLSAGTPLPRARLAVVRRQCSRLGEILEIGEEAEEAAPADACGVLHLTLKTTRSAEQVRGWVARLAGVEEVSVGSDIVEEERWLDGSPHRLSSPLTGSMRVKASLLDRLLDHLEQMSVDRMEVARKISPTESPALAGALNPILGRMERGFARMRSEILAARLVPFDRAASRLFRCVEEAATGGARRAVLKMSGGESRLDLALLEEVAELLDPLLRGVVMAAVGRADLQRQLGRPEQADLRLAVTRSAQRLCLALHFPVPEEASALESLLAGLYERIAALGGSASLIPSEGSWKLEMVLPAGVTLVRSYLCQAGKHLFAVPVASVERAVDLPASRIRISDGKSFWQEDGNDPVPLVRFPRIPWTQADGTSRTGYPGLLYRVGPQRYALAFDAVLGETDVVVRPLKEAGVEGQVAGMALMPDGGIAMVPDLPNLARTR